MKKQTKHTIIKIIKEIGKEALAILAYVLIETFIEKREEE